MTTAQPYSKIESSSLQTNQPKQLTGESNLKEVTIKQSNFQIIGDIGVAVIGGTILVIALIAWVKGWFKTLRKFDKFADKSNLFFDNILPDILDHACKTDRMPGDLLKKWTTTLSTNNVQSQSPMTITEHGRKTIRLADIDKIFEENKESWAVEVKEKLGDNPTKLDTERESIGLIIEKYKKGDKIFNPVKNYLYENRNLPITDVYALFGLLLRDYIFEKYKDLIQ